MVEIVNKIIKIDENYPIADILKTLDNFELEIEEIKKEKKKYIITLKKELTSQTISLLLKIFKKNLPIDCKLYFLANYGLNLKEIFLAKAIAIYQNQLLYEFEKEKIIKTMRNYPLLTKTIIEYFKEKLSTSNTSKEKIIEEELAKITQLEPRKILEFFYIIVKNIVRTNFFLSKDTISFKVLTKNFKNMLFGFQPNIEMFVYHPQFNGIHLRMSKISRGGIRHSNRSDFREEIKDLVKTQSIKNALIIPDGAKGGFVTKDISAKEAYQKYIDALLDLIDFEEGEDKDFYFVVAADKGTAHFSDLANEIAIKRGYFLKDAFASGGSNGYNHKELGITAKGAIESAKRFFLEIKKDIYSDKLSVVGVGSMRGDVFGNGMLLNKNFLLIGAISHSYIFVDPNPNPKIAYEERKRLFEKELGWEAYDKDKISKGGGVFKRDEKIKLSNELKRLFNTKKEYMFGYEIARELLKLPVDMLYFGGIGTYIKASDELNTHISDKENEKIRVDASDIKAYAICEGANLAVTTKGRYEYALKGGKINLDAIDNSAGVNISDYEVNIKIHLNKLVDENMLDFNERNKILKDLTPEVVKKVLANNYAHSLIITLDSKRIYKEKLIKILDILEKTDFFKREYYNIPKNSAIDGMYYKGELIRPLTAIILLNAKNYLKKFIANMDIDYPLEFYFPSKLKVTNHPLKRRIIASTLTNNIINSLGAGFIVDDNLEAKIKAFILIEKLLNTQKLYEEIKSLDYKIDPKKQYELYLDIHETINFGIRWLKNVKDIDLNLTQNFFTPTLQEYKKKKTLLKFLPAILYLSKDYDNELVLKTFERIINKYKISSILRTLQKIKPKSSLEKELKDQTEEMIEYFVIALAKEKLNGKKFKEDIEIKKAKSLQEIISLTNNLILKILKTTIY